MKVHIIGCSGTGKTYLARALSEKYHIPHYDLDDLQWDNAAGTYGVRTPPEKRAAMLQDILAKDDWIVEGVYYAWVGQSFADADVIYLLDSPEYLYKFRILRRFLRRKLGLEPGKKETVASLKNLLKWTDTFQEKNMAEIREILSRYPDKTVILRRKRDVRRCIAGTEGRA